MELKLIDKSFNNYKDCAIEVYSDGKKSSIISFLMFCETEFMLKKLPLVIDGNHEIVAEFYDQIIVSEGEDVTFSFDDNNSELSVIISKNLCIPIFKEMIKLYNS